MRLQHHARNTEVQNKEKTIHEVTLSDTKIETLSCGFVWLRGSSLIQFTSQIFKDGRMYVAYAPELDVSSCATTKAKAQKNLLEAVRLFLEEAEKKGDLEQILEEAGFVRRKEKLEGPKFITTQHIT